VRAFSLIIPLSLIGFAGPAKAQTKKPPKKPTPTATGSTQPAARGLTPAQVQAVLRARRPSLARCLAKSPGLSGKVVVELRLGLAGSVEAANAKRSTLGNKNVESCVLAAVRSWRFPPAAVPTTVTLPLLLKGPPPPPPPPQAPASRPVKPALEKTAPKADAALSDTHGPLPRDLRAAVEVARHGDFTLFIGGLLQVQAAFYAGNEVSRQFGDPVDKEGFRVRRARLSFSGRVVKNFSYYLAIDLKDTVGAASGSGDPGNEILDARILWDRYAWLNISAGVDRLPFSTFSLQSSARLPLIERPIATDLLAPGRRVGLTLLGSLGPLFYIAGIYNGSEGVTTGNQLAGIALAARVGVAVFDHHEQFVPDEPQIKVAAALMYDDQPAVDLLRAAGSLELSGWRTRLTGEFLWERSKPDERPAGTPDAGEVKRWGAIGELSVFVWADLLQLAARYEYFRDNDELPTFGRQQLFSVGLNVYFYQHRLKLQIDYLRRDELEGPEVANDIGLAQLQAMF